MPYPCKDATDIGKNPSWEIASAHFHHVALDSCMSDGIFSATIDANNDREFAFTQDAEKQRKAKICEAPSELDSDGKSDRSTLRFRIARRYCSVAISQQASSLFEDRVLGRRVGWGGQVSLIDQHAPRGAGRWTLGATSVTSLSLLMLQSAHLSMPRTLAYREVLTFTMLKRKVLLLLTKVRATSNRRAKIKRDFPTPQFCGVFSATREVFSRIRNGKFYRKIFRCQGVRFYLGRTEDFLASIVVTQEIVIN
jgi:hypothetical protein